MNSFSEVCAWLNTRGYRVEQVADTDWYKICAPDGRSSLIKKAVLISLAKGEDETKFEEKINWCRCGAR